MRGPRTQSVPDQLPPGALASHRPRRAVECLGRGLLPLWPPSYVTCELVHPPEAASGARTERPRHFVTSARPRCGQLARRSADSLLIPLPNWQRIVCLMSVLLAGPFHYLTKSIKKRLLPIKAFAFFLNSFISTTPLLCSLTLASMNHPTG